MPFFYSASYQSIWFAFTNDREVREALNISADKPARGTATIEIDNYIVNPAPYDIWNKATFIKLIDHDES